MSRKRQINRYEVIIEIPLSIGQYLPSPRTSQASYEEANDIVTAIKRHVSPYHADAKRAFIRVDAEFVCEFCGGKWTEKNDDYNGCCEKDEIAENERQSAKENT